MLALVLFYFVTIWFWRTKTLSERQICHFFAFFSLNLAYDKNIYCISESSPVLLICGAQGCLLGLTLDKLLVTKSADCFSSGDPPRNSLRSLRKVLFFLHITLYYPYIILYIYYISVILYYAMGTLHLFCILVHLK